MDFVVKSIIHFSGQEELGVKCDAEATKSAAASTTTWKSSVFIWRGREYQALVPPGETVSATVIGESRIWTVV